MGTVLILKDGKREIVTKDRHFTDLVREYMGEDAAQYIEDRLKDIFDAVEDAMKYAKECEIADSSLTDIRDILSVVFDE